MTSECEESESAAGMVTDLEEAGVVEEEALLGVQQQVLLPVPVAQRRLHRGLERRLEGECSSEGQLFGFRFIWLCI